MSHVVITGVSSGIGNALAHLYLEQGRSVFGVSRTVPEDLLDRKNFHFCAVDLSETTQVSGKIARFLIHEQGLTHIELLFLNAGQFSQRIAGLIDTPQAEIDYLMRLNVWSNKAVLDCLFACGIDIDTCVFSASIAGVRARAGNNGYALSKSTLLMLAKLYALENPATFFSVLGMCLVDTRLTRQAATMPIKGDFREIQLLRERAKLSGYAVSAQERARTIHELLTGNLKLQTESGDFIEIRSLSKTRQQ